MIDFNSLWRNTTFFFFKIYVWVKWPKSTKKYWPSKLLVSAIVVLDIPSEVQKTVIELNFDYMAKWPLFFRPFEILVIKWTKNTKRNNAFAMMKQCLRHSESIVTS